MGTTEQGLMIRTEVVHCRYQLNLSFWAIIKYIFGATIHQSICIGVDLHFNPDGHYEYAEFSGYDGKAAVTFVKDPDAYDLDEQFKKDFHKQYQ